MPVREALLRLWARLDRRMVWQLPVEGKVVHLTFDDGPEPQVTPWVLETLAQHDAKATFFCLGRNAAQHPELMQRIGQEGHSTGHHTWNHPDGWKTPAKAYLRNVLQGAHQVGGPLFRPPYGHLGLGMARLLCKRFRVVMWDVMGYDFLPGRSGEACAIHVLRRTRPGSIIVLHDNLKSSACLREALPLILRGFAAKGFRCVPIDPPITGRPRP